MGRHVWATIICSICRSSARLSETALTQDKEIAFAANGLPNTFVPGRNLLFFTFAAAIAYRRGINASSAACARPISPATPIAATTR